MKAAVLRGPGDPDAFVIEDVPPPRPGRDEVLVRVAACGVSGHDIAVRNGTFRRGVEFPLISGIELSGTVIELGEGVADLAVGDRVCNKPWRSCGRCAYCRNGMETACPERRAAGDGGYGELAVLPAETLVTVPDDVRFEVAAVLGGSAGVALHATRDTAGVRVGDDVLVTGASGGVGLAAVALAKLAGARVIAQTRSEAKAQELRAAGADEVVAARDDRWFEEVIRLTGGKGVEVVVDTVGSKVFTPAFRSLASYGRYALVGQLTGEEVSINPARIFLKRARLLGVGSVTRSQLQDVVRLVARGWLRPRVARVLPLEEIAAAHALVEGGTAVGRIVVTPTKEQA